MAYNRENKLRIILKVQKTYQQYKQDGNTKAYVFRTYIEPQYHISLSTLDKYLGTRAEHELNKIVTQKEQKQAKQGELFN